jgi:hypothetical protein
MPSRPIQEITDHDIYNYEIACAHLVLEEKEYGNFRRKNVLVIL